MTEQLNDWDRRVRVGPPVTVPREVANLAENLLIRLERDPGLWDRAGWFGQEPLFAAARRALSAGIEASDAARWSRNLHEDAESVRCCPNCPDAA